MQSFSKLLKHPMLRIVLSSNRHLPSTQQNKRVRTCTSGKLRQRKRPEETPHFNWFGLLLFSKQQKSNSE
ncbi:hypothetical protein FGO68_gene1474 [Halteria grandinella]|uniref:Uncharacterized protein n=1 Tax=Halteria grandinella TaxID=5974 RepID=A0A8J8SXQ3_HALGN|nr:hypothetical protein FGO68_gene1474 [Halteria grandinella]